MSRDEISNIVLLVYFCFEHSDYQAYFKRKIASEYLIRNLSGFILTSCSQSPICCKPKMEWSTDNVRPTGRTNSVYEIRAIFGSQLVGWDRIGRDC